ncbi:unnamed protein product [Ectocarpus fasciculatus]
MPSMVNARGHELCIFNKDLHDAVLACAPHDLTTPENHQHPPSIATRIARLAFVVLLWANPGFQQRNMCSPQHPLKSGGTGGTRKVTCAAKLFSRPHFDVLPTVVKTTAVEFGTPGRDWARMDACPSLGWVAHRPPRGGLGGRTPDGCAICHPGRRS